jgi:hypothetical protein
MHKKYRENLKNRPVKICKACHKPITDPDFYKADVHISGIKGVRSECQIIRDKQYKKHAYKSTGAYKKKNFKKPEGLYSKYDVQDKRICLKCDKIFKSQSLHNRICEPCKRHQPNMMTTRSVSLETSNIDELFDFNYNY